MILRSYQEKIIKDFTEALKNNFRRIIICVATGLGKTLIASEIINWYLKNEGKALFFVHRRELLFQTEKHLQELGIKCGMAISGDPWDSTLPVQVASIQTLHSWIIRRKKEKHPEADIIFFDECHGFSGSRTWQDLATLYPESIIVGLTATPISKSGKGLRAYFDHMITGPTYSKSFNEGWLVRPKWFVPSKPDLVKLRIQHGDYLESELAERMDKDILIGDITTNWIQYGENRQTLCFATTVKHSIHLVERFNFVGIPAAHIDAHTPSKDRDRIIGEFKEKKIKVLSSCLVFTEGFDVPSASCVILARPTRSLRLFLQACGRGLRTSENKQDCIFLDHSGLYDQFGPIDQDWDWKLAYNEEERKIQSFQMKKLRTRKQMECGSCHYIYEERLDCPRCNWKPKLNGKDVPTFEAWLQALDEKDQPKVKPIDAKNFYLELRGYQVNKSYNPGWAAHEYRRKFNKWPYGGWRNFAPMVPSSETLDWISKGIRDYKKRMAFNDFKRKRKVAKEISWSQESTESGQSTIF